METEWESGTVSERIAALEDIIFAAVCEGIDSRHLSAKRDQLFLELNGGTA